MEILIDALKKKPGLVVIFATLSLLLLEDNSEIASAIRVFIVTWALYAISTNLDLYWDFFYKPGPRPRSPKGLRRTLADGLKPGFGSLEDKRDIAIKKLQLAGTEGLYVKSMESLKQNGMWEKEVEPWINYSKFCRAWVVPLFAIACVRSVALMPQSFAGHFVEFLNHTGGVGLFKAFHDDFQRAGEKLNILILARPIYPAVLCWVFLLLYVGLRLYHVIKLYDLVAKTSRT